jgi:hypothetical protein
MNPADAEILELRVLWKNRKSFQRCSYPEAPRPSKIAVQKGCGDLRRRYYLRKALYPFSYCDLNAAC